MLWKKKIVTLYIDDTSIRLLVTGGKDIKKWADLPLEPGFIEGGVVTNEVEVAAKVRKLFKEQGVKARKIILGLSGVHCFTRPITLPQLPKSELPEAVMQVAASTLPLSLDQLYITWQVIPSAPAGKTQIFLTAIRRKSADAVIRTLRRAGLKPRFLDIKPLALASLIQEATAIIIDVQPAEFDIIIMVDGVPQPIRTIPFPRESLSWEDKFPLIRNDVDRTIKFYNSNNPDKLLSPEAPVFVSGELTDQPELIQALSRELGYPIFPLSLPVECGPEGLRRHVVNIGLTLKDPSFTRNAGPSVAKLNLLPFPYRPRRVSLIKVVAVPATVAIAILIPPMAMLLQGVSADTEQIKEQLNHTNEVIAQKQNERKEMRNTIAELEKKVAETEKMAAKFDAGLAGFEVKHETINGDLWMAMQSMPAGVTLVRISYLNGTLTISGKSQSEEEVLGYARSLDNCGRFSEVTITRLQILETGIDFTITIKGKS